MSLARSTCALAAACTALLVPAAAASARPLTMPAHARFEPTLLKHPRHALRLTDHGHAVAPTRAPRAVRRLIHAGNDISHLPYVWGGGHGGWAAPGYDCSGSVSYVLHAAGVLGTPLTSGSLESFGMPGPGRWVTIYASSGHTYMVVAGRRFDTTAYKYGGSRWSDDPRGGTGYVIRHPAGL